MRIVSSALCLASVLVPFVGIEAQPVTLDLIGRYESGIFNESAAEIVSYDPSTKRLFVTNSALGGVDILSIVDPTAPSKIGFIDIVAAGYGDAPTSVSFKNGVLAIAVPALTRTDPGVVVFSDADGAVVGTVAVGALPDMLTFTPDGSTLLVANEGEPNDDYSVDPQGSVSVVDMTRGPAAATVRTAGFTAWDGKENALNARGIRVYGPGASSSQDLEPEYIAVSEDSSRAWVTLQENNALAIVDVASATVEKLVPLGYKKHKLPGNGLDPSNRDGGIFIGQWPVQGMYQPDAIASFVVEGKTYLVTANEGDVREYDGFEEEVRIKDLVLGSGLLAANPGIQEDAALGRLITTTEPPQGKVFKDGQVEYRKLFSYGARSFSVWDADGSQVFDSGDAIEQLMALAHPADFNSTDDENDSFDNRSDDKGPEPEAAAVGVVNGVPYAFIGLERIGGILVYDVSTPSAPQYQSYINTRDFSGDAESGTAGDLAPEGLQFISAAESPSGKPLLVVSYEVSGTTVIFEVIVP